MCVFYDSRFKRLICPLLAAHANKNLVKNEEPDKSAVFLLVKTHKYLTSIAVLTVHAKSSLLYTF